MTADAPLPPLPTQAQINARLTYIQNDLDTAREELREAIIAHAAAVRTATLTEAETFMRATGAMDLRKWVARKAAADDQFQVGVALATLEAARARLFNLRDQLNATQTLSANVRAELNALGGSPS
jgi:hypothetical protein